MPKFTYYPIAEKLEVDGIVYNVPIKTFAEKAGMKIVSKNISISGDDDDILVTKHFLDGIESMSINYDNHIDVLESIYKDILAKDIPKKKEPKKSMANLPQEKRTQHPVIYFIKDNIFKKSVICERLGLNKANMSRLMNSDTHQPNDNTISKLENFMSNYGYIPVDLFEEKK
jgi:predicted XRE-type DNA-binding protein